MPMFSHSKQEVFMTVKFYGGSITNCGTGVISHKDADVEFHDGFQMNFCGTGVATYATAEELKIIQEKAQEHMQEIIELAKKLKETKPEKRKAVVAASAVVASLAVGSNTSTVMQFMIDNIPMFADLLK